MTQLFSILFLPFVVVSRNISLPDTVPQGPPSEGNGPSHRREQPPPVEGHAAEEPVALARLTEESWKTLTGPERKARARAQERRKAHDKKWATIFMSDS